MRNYANQYRPLDFDDVVGQDTIVSILKRQVTSNNIKNGYLFTGPAGTGKTTMARILARALNGDLGAGTIEIDAASNTGVDNIRDIIENAKYRSMDSAYKIYIIDEVHMLSTGAFNALLKILEEPPKHVVFIACTTDPQKIPATIMSRLQRFNFNRVSNKNLEDRLTYIAEKEGVKIEPQAISYIAALAGGGVRDAISTLDLCTSMAMGEVITLENVLGLLGKVDTGMYFRFIMQVVTNKPDALVLLNDLWSEGVNIKQFMVELVSTMIDYQVYKLTKDENRMPRGLTDGILADFELYIDSKLLTSIIKNLLDLNTSIRYESNPKHIIEGWVISSDWTN